jgi:hypothetical protein
LLCIMKRWNGISHRSPDWVGTRGTGKCSPTIHMLHQRSQNTAKDTRRRTYEPVARSTFPENRAPQGECDAAARFHDRFVFLNFTTSSRVLAISRRQ